MTAKLDQKKDLCPISGIGKRPEDWSNCVVQCSLYDATTGYCSLHALWLLRSLPSVASGLEDISLGLY